jgi:hypothetical protein
MVLTIFLTSFADMYLVAINLFIFSSSALFYIVLIEGSMTGSTVYASSFLATFMAFFCWVVASTCETSFFPIASGTEVTISPTFIAQIYCWNKGHYLQNCIPSYYFVGERV